MIKRMWEEQPREWDRYIPALLFAYMDSVQESRRYSIRVYLWETSSRAPYRPKGIMGNGRRTIGDENNFSVCLNLKERIEEMMKIAQQILLLMTTVMMLTRISVMPRIHL